MDLETSTKTLVDDTRDWQATAEGSDSMQPIQLDGSTFTGDFPDGKVPSGVALALLGSGLYGLFDGGADEVQSIVATGGSAGTFTLTFSGQTTAAIAFDATAAAVQAALEALSNIDPGDVVCAGGPLPTTPVTVTFKGQYAGINVAQMTVTDSVTGGDAVVTTTTAGSSGATAGSEDGRGLLGRAVQVINAAGDTNDVVGALWTEGVVIESKLPASSGVTGEFKYLTRHTIRWRA